MLSRAAESRLRVVRGILVACWLLLIASLFWDPFTPELTRSDNLASPFRLAGKEVLVQGRALPEEPYAMSNRIFWTMIIPILPLFFMVVGHETWRRLCPLSFVSQIPRYLGWQRKRPVLDLRSGKVTRLLALPSREGWARRNVWYIQFGLLFLALNARILFINSDRVALASFFVGVIVLAVAIGWLYGGKTWCNYVCPIAVVQKIYTEPRGLLESAAHVERRPVSQSMCRAPAAGGDRSICVGCTPSCPDIDLEKSHWDSVLEPERRNVYYMFFGLVLGFYGFYYLYSGGWDYYFSGAWTHEAGQLAALWGPGLHIGGVTIPIPKILAAPLVLGTFVLGALGLGIVLEKGYRRLRARMGRPLPEAEFMNQCLAFSAYVTINAFYLFGGRPNLSLLPGPALRLVDILIVALSTLWFWQAVQRTPLLYRREGLASSLLEQLRTLKVDVSRFLEGRTLEELKPDEVYVLAKTLPQFSHEQKVHAYRNVLEDALQRGKTNSAASLEMLREVRTELGVNDEEHRRLLEELGAEAGAALDPDQAASYENWVRVGNYKRSIELAIVPHLERGQPLADVLALREVESAIAENRDLYRITPSEHDAVLAQVTGGGGLLFERARSLLEPMLRCASLRLGLAALMARDEDGAAIARLLSKVLRQRIVALCSRQFAALLTLGESPEARWLAANLGTILGSDLDTALAEPVAAGSASTWEDSLAAETVAALRGGWAAVGEDRAAPALPEGYSFHAVIDEAVDLPANLARLAAEDDPPLQAIALTALSYLDLGRARQVGAQLAAGAQAPSAWLLRDAVGTILGDGPAASAPATRSGSITVTVAAPNAPANSHALEKPYVTIGRHSSNDVMVAHPAVSPFHLALSVERGAVQLRKVDPGTEAFVDGHPVGQDAVGLRSGARISLRPTNAGGPILVVEWGDKADGGFSVQSYDTVTRLLWLSGVRVFESLDLNALADIAETAEVRIYRRGSWLCRAGEPSAEAYVLQAGETDVLGTRGGRETRIGSMGPGSIIGEIGVITERPRAASVRVRSATARVVAINGERIRRLMRHSPSVAMGMLVGVASYVGTPGAAGRDPERAASMEESAA